ncbi:hypothetical protein PG995_012112 [Apiospora arundinis]
MSLPLLPIELLHHVASYCSPRDILALAGSCQSLRNAYDNITVFRCAFAEHVPLVSSRSIASTGALVAQITKQLSGLDDTGKQHLVNDQQRLTWKCLAMAASKLPHINDQLNTPVSAISSDLARRPHTITHAFQRILSLFTLPGLPKFSETTSFPETVDTSRIIDSLQRTLGLLSMSVVWGCSSVCDDNVMRLLDEICTYMYALTPQNQEPPYLPRSPNSRDLEISFCLAVCAIQNAGWLRIESDAARAWPQGRLAFVPRALRRLLQTFGHEWGVRAGAVQDVFPQSMALLMCALVARAYLKSLPEPDSAPPRPEDIPFVSSNGHIPSPSSPGMSTVVSAHRVPYIPLPEVTRTSVSPFATGSWDLWYKARARAVMDEIDSGEWEGCYTYGLEAQARTDPLMRHIRFQKSPTRAERLGRLTRGDDGQHNQVNIKAEDCVDRVGGFRLDGHLDRETCNITVRKQYRIHFFDWKGAVTPLGIAGYYYSDQGELVPLGAFWLWKREWKAGS